MGKKLSDSISSSLSMLGSTLKSTVKIALQSRRPTMGGVTAQGDTVIVMGNGPSLRQTIAEYGDTLRRYPSMAVNFAACAPEFATLRPEYYIIADPHFFSGSRDGNMGRLHEALTTGVDWPMTLFVPVGRQQEATALVDGNPNITIVTFNPVGAEGFGWFTRLVYRLNLAMPRPRNVLIPALMTAIGIGYQNVYIVGADHSWMKTIDVNSDNEVVSVQPHFYKEREEEKARVTNEYRGYRLHDIIASFYVAFKAYHDIRRYADSRGVTVYNSTPSSFIDAFPRRGLPEA